MDQAYEDFLEGLFSNEPVKSETDDIRISLSITPQEAGLSRVVTFPANMPCPHCSGDGMKPVPFLPLTRGCRSCQSLGIVNCQKDFQFTIPVGVHDGDTLSFPGKGLYTPLRQSRGDLYIQIRIKPGVPRSNAAPPFVAPQPSFHQVPSVAGQPFSPNHLTFHQEPTLANQQRQTLNTVGNYRLTRLLGQGGYADVYLGEHQYLRDRQVAIKILREHLQPQDVQDFLQEAQTIAALHHPHIVSILDCGVEGTSPYLVMTYANRGTLRDRHPKGSRLTLSIIIPYIRQIALALQYAHDHRLIHRDVKPENMLLDEQNAVLLSDFGIAVAAHQTHSMKLEDRVGTFLYTAPEQVNGSPRPASDQYALAVVVYEWLCGTTPFKGTRPVEIAVQHINAPPLPLRAHAPSISPAVERVVLQALTKDPHQRFDSVQAFAQALEAAGSR